MKWRLGELPDNVKYCFNKRFTGFIKPIKFMKIKVCGI